MSPPPDNAVVSDNPPELSSPEHEGSLQLIPVQYVPVKQKKPSSSSCVTGTRILTREECDQIIFEREEKKRKEKEARRVAREQRKKEKEEATRKKIELAEKRKEEVAEKKEEAA